MYTGLYPEDYRFKYPKAGESNSTIHLFVYELSLGKQQQVKLGNDTDIYIPRIKWGVKPNQLFIERLNRLQNELNIILYDALKKIEETIYTEANQTYIEVPEIHTTPNGKQLIFTSERSGYNHLYLLEIASRFMV
jgi:dipeptidyl-peptidase-4